MAAGKDGEGPRKRFMLHRALPMMDLFTSAAVLSEEDLAELTAVPDTDVIAVVPSAEAGNTVGAPARTLKDINPPPKVPLPPLQRPAAPKQTPVQLLYYDPFSSFAPTHDSSNATLSYSQSIAHRATKSRIRKWEQEVLPLEPALPALDTFGLDESAMQWAQNAIAAPPNLASSEEVWDELDANGRRFNVLVRGQWERIKKAKDIGPVEAAAAKELLSSLAHLVQKLPPSTITPPAPALASALPLVMGSITTDPDYVGTLDDNNFIAVRESGMSRPRPKKKPEPKVVHPSKSPERRQATPTAVVKDEEVAQALATPEPGVPALAPAATVTTENSTAADKTAAASPVAPVVEVAPVTVPVNHS